MLGGVSLIAELADDSIGVPPASRGPVYAPVTMLRVVWHPAQFATALTRYSPRSTVGACAGLSTGGVAACPIGLIMNAITALPSRLSCWSGNSAIKLTPPNITAGGKPAEWTEDQWVARFHAGERIPGSPMPWQGVPRTTDEALPAP